MLHFLPPENQTCLATNQIAASCEKLLQKLERSFTYCNKICTCCAFYRPQLSVRQSCFAVPVWSEFRAMLFNQKSRQYSRTFNNLICWKKARPRAVKRATSLYNSFCNNVAKQVCCCKTSCAFLLPVFSNFRDKIKLINSKFELTNHEIIASRSKESRKD